MRLLDEQFLLTSYYGSRQMARCLRRKGYCVGRHRVRGLMRIMGLRAIYQEPRTSQPIKINPAEIVEGHYWSLDEISRALSQKNSIHLNIQHLIYQMLKRKELMGQKNILKNTQV